MRKRFLNFTLAMGLVAGLLAGAVGTASAESFAGSGLEWLFYPWVPNGETIDGDGPWYGTVTVQNLEDYRIDVAVGATASSSVTETTIEPFASKTFSAASLGVAEPGGGVAVVAGWDFDTEEDQLEVDGVCGVTLDTGEEVAVVRGGTANTADDFTDPDGRTIVSVDNVSIGGVDFIPGVDYATSVEADGSSANVSWAPAGAEPIAGAAYTVEYTVESYDCVRGPEIAGASKHAMPAPALSANNRTSAAHITVDGYTAIPDEDVPWGPGSEFCQDAVESGLPIHKIINFFLEGTLGCSSMGSYILGLPFGAVADGFDGHSYLPIVQTNNGWNSVIHITNIDPSSPDASVVNVHYYEAFGQGAAGPSFSDVVYLDQGDSAVIDVGALVGDEWVGSVWITSDYGVVANVSRVKPSTEMAVTNTAAPSLWAITSVDDDNFDGVFDTAQVGSIAEFEMYAPLLFNDWNGWNTGISIVNLSEFQNTVTINYYDDGSSTHTETLTIPAKGMEYVYTPAMGDADGFKGSAVLSSILPFHAAIDEVKYSTGEAMSYIATAATAGVYDLAQPGNDFSVLGFGPRLAAPIIQKGSPSTGLGDTSGIELFNAVSDSGATVWGYFFDPAGNLVAPSLNLLSPWVASMGPLGGTTFYTLNVSEMPVGHVGSAMIFPVMGGNTDNEGSVAGVTNVVNYDVQGDGAAVFNLFNTWGQFRFFVSQNPCLPVGQFYLC